MLIDASLVLSNAQAVTASGASTHTIDQQAKGHTHHRCAFLARVEETFAGLTNLKISLQTSDTADFASAEELASVSAAGAYLTAGQVLLKVPFPLGARRYIRGYYTVTGTGTAGKVSLFVADGAEE